MGDPTVARCGYYYNDLPYVHLAMKGGFSRQAHNVDLRGDTKRSHFEQEFNWSINEEHQEFVIRIRRKPEAARVNVACKIEGGLSYQPDGSEVFDGSGCENGVTTFGLTFKISQVGQIGDQPNSQQAGRTADSSGDPNSQQALAQYPQQALAQYPQQALAQYPQQALAQYPQQALAQYPQQALAQYPQQALAQYALAQGCYGLNNSMPSLSLQYPSSNQTFMSFFEAHNDTCSEKYRCNPCQCSQCKTARIISECPGCHCSKCQRYRLYS